MRRNRKMESLKINGMSCEHCVGSVKKALEEVPGLSGVTVDLAANEAKFVNTGVDREVIKNAITKIGFEPVE